MKAKFNFKRKRTIIIIAVIAVVAIAASVAGYYFMKGNNTAGATNAGEQISGTTDNEQLEIPVDSEQGDQNNQENLIFLIIFLSTSSSSIDLKSTKILLDKSIPNGNVIFLLL